MSCRLASTHGLQLPSTASVVGADRDNDKPAGRVTEDGVADLANSGTSAIRTPALFVKPGRADPVFVSNLEAGAVDVLLPP